MDHPSQIFSRIRRQKARPALPRQGRDIPLPAPAPARAQFPAQSPAQSPTPMPSSTPAPTPTPMPSPAPTQSPAPARPARGHALYSQVMRSHDRMGTRHV